jgi:hypothetical protein
MIGNKQKAGITRCGRQPIEQLHFLFTPPPFAAISANKYSLFPLKACPPASGGRTLMQCDPEGGQRAK